MQGLVTNQTILYLWLMPVSYTHLSPDGKKIAWESMEREGYESDRIRPFIYDFTKDTMWEAVRCV